MKTKRILAGVLACAAVFGSVMPTVSADNSLAPTLMGDVNTDETVDISDVILLSRYTAEDTKITVTKQGLANADLNADGKYTAEDVTKIIRKIAMLDEPYRSGSKDLMEGITASANFEGLDADDAYTLAQTKFSLNLLKQNMVKADQKETNPLLSPLSAVFALGMTANGAKGDTLTGMEDALGGLPIDTLNRYLYTQRNILNAGDNIKLANAIWFRDDGTRELPLESFLTCNADCYDAGLFAAPFDETTLDDVNGFVNENTAGRISKILDEISEYDRMYLVNALTFDGQWGTPYEKYQVIPDEVFTAYDGTENSINAMYSSEVYHYLEDENATGFVKWYEGGDYCFAALLPNEGVDIYDYVNGLDAEGFSAMLKKGMTESIPENWTLHTMIPKFKLDYGCSMADSLKAMGMETAFDDQTADFSNMFEHALRDGVHIANVIQKTHIEVSEAGTKAAAATIVIMEDSSCVLPEKTVDKYVYLDRPFVYMIMDANTAVPVFIGMVTNLDGCSE